MLARIVVFMVTALLAGNATALELRAYVPGSQCPTQAYVIVRPGHVPPPGTSDPCIVAMIPAGAHHLAWTATEVWELPTPLSPAEAAALVAGCSQSDAGCIARWAPGYRGWTRLTCGASYDGPAIGWSFSCFDAGELGVEGLHYGTATQLDQVVRAWWDSRRLVCGAPPRPPC